MIINNVGSYITAAGSAIGGFGGIIDSPSSQAAPFVGPLDALVSQGANVVYAASSNRLLTSYTGNACRLVGNGTGNPEADIGFLANGQLDLAAAAAIAAQDGGTAAFGLTWYGQQASNVINATQSTSANRPPFSTALNAQGGWGNGVASQSWFNINLSSYAQWPFFVSAVVKTVNVAANRILMGTSATATNRYMRTNAGAMQQNWGTALAGTSNEISDGLHTLGFLVDKANSKHYLDGALIKTGDSGDLQNSFGASGRIGANTTGSTAWLNTGGNAILEIVVFLFDPTTLPGWNAFVANQLARFS